VKEKLDVKDKKILYELDINSRQSNSQIGKKVLLSKEVVNYRITQLEKRGVIKNFYCVLNTLALGFHHYKIYFKLQNIDLEKEKEITNYFEKNKQCIWIGSCRGNWDLAVSFLAKNPLEFGKLYQEITKKYGANILEKNILLIEKAPTFNRAYLKKEAPTLEFVYQESKEQVNLDKTDKRILKTISKNARIKFVELMQRLNLSRDKITYRIKRLQKKGVLQAFRANINLNKVGLQYHKILFNFKNFNEKREKELISYCKNNKRIIQYIKLIGNWDAEIEFEVKNDSELHKNLIELKNKFSDIIRNNEQLMIYEQKLDYYPF
jgi:DNA-binding Lrp family transcriptional regulator